jgi:hypothetical protein
MLRFVQTAGFALGFALLGGVLTMFMMSGQPAALAQQSAAQESAAKGPLRHVVLFKFKDASSKEDVGKIVEAFGQLPKRIDGITDFEWGTDVSPEGKSEGFTHCFVVTFDNAKSRDAYLPHAAHKEFVTLLLPHLDKVLVVDYFAQK